MKGYKGMNRDMTCRGMKFEVGKTYHVGGEIIPCRNGLHFCERLTDVFDYYGRENGNRFFEVETFDLISTVKTIGNKAATSDLTIIRELTDIEINRIVYGNGYGDSTGIGDGTGDGTGDGDGWSWGDGDGYGYGYGYGSSDGNGWSRGYGNGNGYGYGYGSSDGNGYGNGYGNISGDSIHKILLLLLFT